MGLSGTDSFKEQFNSVKKYIFDETGYIIDKSCCNPNRLRIISCDDNPRYKDPDSDLVLYQGKTIEKSESIIYKPLLDFSLPQRSKPQNYNDLLNDDKFCIMCSDYCINKLGLKTTDYSNWLSHMGTLSTLGSEGERLGIQLSRQSPKYKSDEDVIKNMRSLSRKGGQREFITRYFRMCKESLGKNWIQEIKTMYDKNIDPKKKLS